MEPRLWEDSDALFRRCLAASAAFHLALILFGNSRARFDLALPRPEVVIDLTLPLRDRASAPAGPIGRPAPPTAQGAPAHHVKLPEPAPIITPPKPAPESVATPSAPPKPDTDPVPVAAPRPPAPEPAPAVSATPADPNAGSGTGGNPGGSAAGNPAFTGGGDGTGPGGRTATPDVLPTLLNRSEVVADLLRYYPEAERRAGKESRVVVKLLLDVTGKVGAVDILTSGGPAFDAAARRVAERMRFSPAIIDGKAIPVTLPKTLVFKLE